MLFSNDNLASKDLHRIFELWIWLFHHCNAKCPLKIGVFTKSSLAQDSDFSWSRSNQNELMITLTNQSSGRILQWWTLAITFLIRNSNRAWCPTVRQNTPFEHISIYKLFDYFCICVIGLCRDEILGMKFPEHRLLENIPGEISRESSIFRRSLIRTLASSLHSSRYFFDS